MEQRGFKFEVKSIDEQGVFEGYAAVFGNEDLGGDIIEPGAFKKTLQENPRMPILWQHDPREPIGVTLEAYEDMHGLRVRGQLNLETSRGREAYALLKQGALKGLSIGYDAVKEIWEGSKRRLKEIRLWEWSLVTFPMNPLAQVTAVKAVVPFQDLPLASEDRAWDADAARARIAKWASSDGSGDKDKINWSKYRRAFLWYDSENPENFGSYKMPIADVLDGELKAIPKAIYAAAAAIQGARGGVDIPAEDKEAVKRHLEKYYKKLGKQPPWTEKQLDTLLQEVVQVCDEHKAGRVLSAANRRLVEQAIQALQALLEAAEPQTDDGKADKSSDLLDLMIKELKNFLSEVA